MQLLIDIENDSVGDKIIQILKVFQNDGVKIIQKGDLNDQEFMERNWETLVRTNEDPDIDDDEMLGQAMINWERD